MKIVSRGYVDVKKHHARSFSSASRPGSGWSFECDERGNVLEPQNVVARKNFEKCLAGDVDGEAVVDEGVVSWETSHRVPSVGECNDCGERVTLSGFTNTCSCGADYNSAGQMLAHRSQWGEETGEHLSDILNIP